MTMPDPLAVLGAILLLVPIVGLLGFAGCGLFSLGGTTPYLAIEPTAVQLFPGQTVEFTVLTTLYFSTSSGIPELDIKTGPDKGPVTVDDPVLTPPGVGTIQRVGPQGSNRWVYTAPGTIESQTNVTISVHASDPHYSPPDATVTATVTLRPRGFELYWEPQSTLLGPSEPVVLTLHAIPTEARIAPPELIPAGVGSLVAGPAPRTWIYTAPAFIGVKTPPVTVSATATFDVVELTNVARIEFRPVVVLVRPPVAVLRPGRSQIFIATVNGADSTLPAGRVNWSPNATDGLYLAGPFSPADPATDTVTATSVNWPAAPPGWALVRRAGPVLRINCGGPLVADPAGESDWLADASNGSSVSTFFDVVDHQPPASAGTVVSFAAVFPGDPRFAGLGTRYLTCKRGIDFSYVFHGFNAGVSYRVTLSFFDLISGVGGRNANVIVTDSGGARAPIMIVPTSDVGTPLTPPIVRDLEIGPPVTPRPDGTFEIRFTVVDRINAVALVNAIQLEFV